MARKKPYGISYHRATKQHLRAIEGKYQSLIRAAIEKQLQFEPGKETRNRKPLRQPAVFAATWEIRFDRGRGGGIVKVATEDEVAADFAEYLKASQNGPIVVTSKGKPVAVLLSPGTEDDLERLLMGHSPKLQAILEAARKRFRQGHGIPHESFWKEVEEENPSEGTKQARTGKNGRTKRSN
jgi:hypothetical protein